MAPGPVPIMSVSPGVRVPQYSGKITPYVAFACVVAASGGLLFGYDIGVTGGVTSMTNFLLKFFPRVYRKQAGAAQNNWCKFDSQLLQLFTSVLFLAGMFGGLLASFFTSRFGRVRTILISGCLFVLGATLNGVAWRLWVLVVGRVLLGFGVGFANQAVPLYLSEMAPAHWRGAMNQMFQLATTLGILAAQLINYGTEKLHPYGWRISLALAGVPGIVLAVGGLLLPETPNSQIERGHLEQGRATLVKIRGTYNVQAEYEDILAASVRARAVRSPGARAIFRRAYRPQLTWAVLIPLFQQLTGINAIMFYVPVLFKTLGFGASASLYSAVITGAVNVLATLVSIFTVDRVGRRALFFSGGLQMLVSQIVVACLLGVYFNGTKSLSSGLSVLVVVVICVYVAGFAWSWGPLGWLVPSEIQQLETRSAGQAITVFVNFLFTFIIGQAFLSMLCHMRYGIFLFFAGWVIIMTLAVYFFLPETKNIPIEDIFLAFKAHWFWRKYVGDAHLLPGPLYAAVSPPADGNSGVELYSERGVPPAGSKSNQGGGAAAAEGANGGAYDAQAPFAPSALPGAV
eukprot:jgi/Mesen1/10857/ME000093S10369